MCVCVHVCVHGCMRVYVHVYVCVPFLLDMADAISPVSSGTVDQNQLLSQAMPELKSGHEEVGWLQVIDVTHDLCLIVITEHHTLTSMGHLGQAHWVISIFLKGNIQSSSKDLDAEKKQTCNDFTCIT